MTEPRAPAWPQLLERTTALAGSFLESLPERPVGARGTVDELRATLGGPLPAAPADPVTVIEELARNADPGIIGMPGPRYFGFVIGGALPAALGADWLTSAWDQNAHSYATGPAASVAEEVAGEWLVELFGLPSGTSFGLATGCQMAHFTCLAAARHALLARSGWDVERRGLFGAPEIEVLVGAEGHATLHTALQYLGLGADRVTVAGTDGQGRMDLGSLRQVLGDGDASLLVCLQAGNVNTGAFDPLGPIIEEVRRRRPNAWVHVDGAFGLWAAVSPELRHLLDGAGAADSWATDGHKWLNVPYDAGYAFVADASAHHAALAPPRAAYIQYGTRERDEFEWVPEYSRRARGFATYAALRSLGRDGVREMVERCCRIARQMADRLAAEAGVEVLNEVVLNQVLVRFTAEGHDPDALTRDVIRRVQEDGTCWLGGTTWHGTAAMRISVSNWSTTAADADRSVEAILRSFQAGRVG